MERLYEFCLTYTSGSVGKLSILKLLYMYFCNKEKKKVDKTETNN